MSTEDEVRHADLRPLLLLDTSVLTLRARRIPPAGLREWLEIVAEFANFCICFPVLVEFRRGLNLCTDPAAAVRIRRAIEEIEQTNFIYFSMDRQTEQAYADLLSIPELKQFWHPDPKGKNRRVSHDLMVAATAVTYQVPIVTADSDFRLINQHLPLPGVFDPLKGRWEVEPKTPLPLPALPYDLEAPIF